VQILAGRYARAFEQNRDLGFETAFNNPAAQPAKEIAMDITDLLIHVHPALSAEQRAKIEEALRGSKGVVSVHFSPAHPHVLTVAYDPEASHAGQLLQIVREWDQAATMAGL